MFSCHYWWKFFHASLHGFPGFVFGTLVYAMIPVYIATTIITYRTKEMIIPIPLADKISKIFAKKSEAPANKKTETEEENKETVAEPEYPSELPPELRVPFMRAKNRIPLTSAISVYNKTNSDKKNEAVNATAPAPAQENVSENNDIPIPMDFDISDTISPSMNDSVPTFTDINFDIPIATETELSNNTTKYLTDKNIEYETYRDYVATDKFNRFGKTKRIDTGHIPAFTKYNGYRQDNRKL